MFVTEIRRKKGGVSTSNKSQYYEKCRRLSQTIYTYTHTHILAHNLYYLNGFSFFLFSLLRFVNEFVFQYILTYRQKSTLKVSIMLFVFARLFQSFEKKLLVPREFIIEMCSSVSPFVFA